MVVGYVGYERCDIAYYLAKLSIGLNQSTLIVDNSISGDLFRSIAAVDDRVREFSNYTVVRNLNVTEEEVRNFENTIIYHGLSRFDESYEVIADYTYVAVTMSRHVIYDAAVSLKKSGLDTSKKTIMVLVDEVAKKFSLQSIADDIGITPSNGYVIPINEIDHAKYEALCNNGIVSMKNTSPDMAEVISEAAKEIYNVNPKNIKRLITRL